MPDTALADFVDVSEPARFIGKDIEYRGRRYELARIAGIGMEKIVFVLRNRESREEPYVLRVYRETMTRPEFETYQKQVREHMDKLFGAIPTEGEHYVLVKPNPPDFFFIGDRPVDVMEHMDGPTLGELRRVQDAEQDADGIEDALEKNDFASLQELSHARLGAQPLHPKWLTIEAWAKASSGNYHEAAEALRMAIEVDATKPTNHVLLGVILVNQGRVAEGLRAAEEAIKHNPSSEVWLELASLNCFAMRLHETQVFLEKAIESGAEGDRAASLRQDAQILEQQLSQIGDQIRKTAELWTSGEAAEAKDLLYRLVDDHPHCFAAWSTLGHLLLAEERYEDAVKCLGNAYAADDRDQHTRLLLGYAEHANGNTQQALSLHLEWTMEYLQRVDRLTGHTQGRTMKLSELTDAEAEPFLMRDDIIEDCRALRELYEDVGQEDPGPDEEGLRLLDAASRQLQRRLASFEITEQEE